MKKSILSLSILLIMFSSFETSHAGIWDNLISRPDAEGDGGSSGAPNGGLPQKNEKGILATLALTYTKVRNACLDGSTKVVVLRESGVYEFIEIEKLNGMHIRVPTCDPLGNISITEAECFFSKNVNALIRIELSNGDTLCTTKDHLIMSENGEYVEAEKLSIGFRIMTSQIGSKRKDTGLEITKIQEIRRETSVYDISVKSKNHNFMVVGNSNKGYFVHNCRDAYDEIMYWRDVYNTYETMKGWFERNKRGINDIYAEACRLVTDPGDIYATFDRMSQIFDKIDYIAVYETKNFDRIMCDMENNVDNAVVGAIRPFTGATFSFVDAMLEGNVFNKDVYTKGNVERGQKPLTKKEEKMLNEYIAQRKIVSEVPKENWPDYRLLEASNMISSSAMSKSRMYNNWAMETSSKIQATDRKLKDLKGVNEIEMGGTWYALENANANNKLLEHSLEEVKVLQGLLGVDMWFMSQKRVDQLNTMENAAEFKYSIRQVGSKKK